MKNPSFQMRGAAVLVASPLLYRSSCVNSPLVLLLEVKTFEMIKPRQNDELTAENGSHYNTCDLDWTGPVPTFCICHSASFPPMGFGSKWLPVPFVRQRQGWSGKWVILAHQSRPFPSCGFMA